LEGAGSGGEVPGDGELAGSAGSGPTEDIVSESGLPVHSLSRTQFRTQRKHNHTTRKCFKQIALPC
jgi:hypothetical protein